MRFLSALPAFIILIGTGVFDAAPVHAQQTWRSMPVDDLLLRIERLETELNQARSAAQGGGGNPGEVAQRLNQLENAVGEINRRGGAAPAPASATPAITDLSARVRRLESLQSGGQSGGSNAAVPELMTRLDQMESEIRRLTGLVEQLQFEQQRLREQVEKRFEDVEFRLRSLEDSPGQAMAVAPVQAAPVIQPAPPVIAPPVVAQPIVAQPRILQPQTVIGQPQPQILDAPPTTIPTRSELAGPVISLGAPAITAPALLQPPGMDMGLAPGGPADPRVAFDEAVRMIKGGAAEDGRSRLQGLVAQQRLDPNMTGAAKYWIGESHFMRGDYTTAAAEFLDSFKRWPDGPMAADSLLRLGMTLANLGQLNEACVTFQQLPSRYPAASADTLNRAGIESRRNQCG